MGYIPAFSRTQRLLQPTKYTAAITHYFLPLSRHKYIKFLSVNNYISHTHQTKSQKAPNMIPSIPSHPPPHHQPPSPSPSLPSILPSYLPLTLPLTPPSTTPTLLLLPQPTLPPNPPLPKFRPLTPHPTLRPSLLFAPAAKSSFLDCLF